MNTLTNGCTRRLSVSIMVWAIAALPPPAPASVDLLARYQKERVHRIGIREALSHDDARFASEWLVDPSSPYSEPIDQPAMTNDIEWEAAVGDLNIIDRAQALDSVRKVLGFTRARPGIDVVPDPRYRDAFIGAGAAKAHVDPDIFWHSLDLTGYAHSTKAAFYAIGLQILRDQTARIPESPRRRALGVDEDVLDRIMAARRIEDVSSHDLRYIDRLVRHRLIHRKVDPTNSLPVEFRIGRLAAAYRDAEGYAGGPPCTRDAKPHPRYGGWGSTGDPRPLCFVAATDRAVHRWYLAETRRQASHMAPEARESVLSRLARVMAPVLALLDIAAFVEMGELIVADDLVAEGTLSEAEAGYAMERVSALTCPLKP